MTRRKSNDRSSPFPAYFLVSNLRLVKGYIVHLKMTAVVFSQHLHKGIPVTSVNYKIVMLPS